MTDEQRHQRLVENEKYVQKLQKAGHTVELRGAQGYLIDGKVLINAYHHTFEDMETKAKGTLNTAMKSQIESKLDSSSDIL